MHWSHRTQYGRRNHSSHSRQKYRTSHRRIRQSVLLLHIRTHLHRRRKRNGLAQRIIQPRQRIRTVSSHGNLRSGMPHDRGMPWRRRHSKKFRRRTIHGTLCSIRQGPGIAGCRIAINDYGNQRRTRCRTQEGSRKYTHTQTHEMYSTFFCCFSHTHIIHIATILPFTT